MPHAILINSENPLGTSALKPIRAGFNYTRREKVITLAALIPIFIESGDNHACFQFNFCTEFIFAAVAVR